MFGGEVPYGELWRMGANEATHLHIPFFSVVAGMDVEPGSYTMYARPDAERFRVFLSRAVRRWGLPISDAVRGQQIGSRLIPVETPAQYVDTLTIRLEPGTRSADLILEWEMTRLVIPIVRVEPPENTEEGR